MKLGIGIEQNYLYNLLGKISLAIGGGISYDVFNGKNLFNGRYEKS